MSQERYLIRQANNQHIVWFADSNQWIMMNEPQGFIFHLYCKGVPAVEAFHLLGKDFEQGPYNFEWVQNLYDSFETLDSQSFSPPDFTVAAAEALHYNIPLHSTHTYGCGDKTFSISFANAELETYIHFPFAHLASAPVQSPGLKLEVFPFKGRFVLRINGKRCLTTEESPQMKRLLFVELAKTLWGKGEDQWIAHLHASAVVCDERVIMFASPSGSGKSTMAALMIKGGCRLFADDFITVCDDKKLVYPFPAALSIKQGSLPVMGSEAIQVPLLHNNMGYIPHYIDELTPLASHIMVFVQYRKDAPTSLEPLSPAEALGPFLQESWVTDTLQGAQAFWQWFTALSFYRLEYSNNEEAVQAVKHIPYPCL
jgi:hypothetical protein